MSVSEELKKVRSNNQSFSDPDESPSASRIIMLSDEERKIFEGAKPGQELVCEVRGNLEDDGHFHVMSVQPLNGKYSGEESSMANEVMNRIPGMTMKG